MAHRFVEHVGEVELALEADSRAGLLREAAAAFRELVDGARPRRKRELLRLEIELPPAEPELLLVDWLNQLVFHAEVDAFVPERVGALEVGPGGVRATVEGVRGRPRHLVKAATLHDLELTHAEGRWRARVVLDV